MACLHLAKYQTNELLYIGFNQDFGCFAVGTDEGFRIYNCEPFKETFRRDFASGGIGIVEMLFRCNILALVGGGRVPRYPSHKVMIWDDHQNRCIGELSFRSEVKAVRLRRDRVVVALVNKVYVYNFADLSLLDHIDTAENTKGLCAVCPSPSNNVLACPSLIKGQVRVELYDSGRTTLIAAHESALSCLTLNMTGTRLATASDKGTLIRVYDTLNGEILQELRRGADKAEIYSISFNQGTTMLACTSDKGTVHIFRLKETVHDAATLPAVVASAGASTTGVGTASTGSSGASIVGGVGVTATAASGAITGRTGGAAASGGAITAGALPSSGTGASAGDADTVYFGAGAGGASGAGGDSNMKSTLSFIKGILPKYFSSEWSFAQFRVPDTRSICSFGQEPNTIIVVGADGSFFKANFERGGEATRVAYSQFVKSGTPDAFS